jgi:hypothetical protein
MQRVYPFVTVLFVALSGGCGGSSGQPDAEVYDQIDGHSDRDELSPPVDAMGDPPEDALALDGPPLDGPDELIDGGTPDGPLFPNMDGGPSESCPGMDLCGQADLGFDLVCHDGGTITLDDLSEDFYCAPGESEATCYTGGYGDFTVVHHCKRGCGEESIWFATQQEVDNFVFDWMCSDGDGDGLADAGL